MAIRQEFSRRGMIGSMHPELLPVDRTNETKYTSGPFIVHTKPYKRTALETIGSIDPPDYTFVGVFGPEIVSDTLPYKDERKAHIVLTGLNDYFDSLDSRDSEENNITEPDLLAMHSTTSVVPDMLTKIIGGTVVQTKRGTYDYVIPTAVAREKLQDPAVQETIDTLAELRDIYDIQFQHIFPNRVSASPRQEANMPQGAVHLHMFLTGAISEKEYQARITTAKPSSESEHYWRKYRKYDIYQTDIAGHPVKYRNKLEYEAIYDEIFRDNEYGMVTIDVPNPVILDVGAHIGLTTIRFKQDYPDAQITCFEPMPANASLLRDNTRHLPGPEVTVVENAVAASSGYVPFFSSELTEENGDMHWTWGNSLVANQWIKDEPMRIDGVATVQLSDYINGPIDLLKMDIEGAETSVLKEIEGKAQHIKQVVMEYHGSSINPQNNLENILRMLEEYGFSVDIYQDQTKIQEDEIHRTDPYWLILHARRTKGEETKNQS